jgi:hypothetical protein
VNAVAASRSLVALMLMDERPESDLAAFPLVRYAQGGPAPDGSTLLVEGATAEGESVRFALSLVDVQHFVAFLLISVGQMGVMRGDQAPTPDEAIVQSPAVRATSIAVGQPAGNQGYLGIAVGRAELIFSMPLSAFEELGRTLLTMSAKSDGRYEA